MDSVRADIDLIQTEWDVCARELQAARERVHTQTRVRAVSAELTDLDQGLEEQDQWLESTLGVEKCDKAELRNLSGECEVRVVVTGRLWRRWQSRSSTNQRVGGLIPSSSSPHVKVSLGKILNPKMPSVNVFVCRKKCFMTRKALNEWTCTVLSPCSVKVV